MVHNVLPPCVEDGRKAYLYPQTPPGAFDKRLGGCLEKDCIDSVLISQGKGVELLRESKDHMEIRDGKKLLLPCFKPLLLFKKLTLGAMPVSAGVIGYFYVTAFFALIDVASEFSRSADLDGVHGAELIAGKSVGVSE
jgi:hypothetical protein